MICLLRLKDKKKVSKPKEILKKEFEMKDLRPATRILGMDITRDKENGILKLSLEGYVKQVPKTFGMKDNKPVVTPVGSQFKLKSLTPEKWEKQKHLMDTTPYASAVGSLMYAMI